MADLRRQSGGRSSERPSERVDRAQLLLVGALALAVLFVALALLLNTAIYTGNLATREAGVDSAGAIEYASEARTAGEDAIRSVNYRNNSSHSALNTSLRSTLRIWDDAAAQHRAVVGDGADVDLVGATNGTRIQQDDVTQKFTTAGGVANWTVASDPDLSGLRSLRLTVDETTLASGPSDDAFHLNVASDAGTRNISVYDDSGPTVQVSENGSVVDTCSPGSFSGDTFRIDVANASVGGSPCSNLSVVDDVGGDLEIAYTNGDEAGGRYTMVVDEPGVGPASSDPYSTPAIYAADLHVTYRTPKLDYEARIEVVPE
ncbi:hypothetical protein [Halobellus inordinatus]|uniref:hypothetical protein n=1 Tax=Halobellus inordinatus TaxID=1126236 RepID=UPI00210ABF8C|nr:hypothetical protein [Halobellus inordinatus]